MNCSRSATSFHYLEIDPDIEAGPAGVVHELLRRRMRRPVGKGRGRGVHRVRAVLDALHDHVGRKPRQAVAVDLQRQPAARLLRGRYEGSGALGGEQSARILEKHAVDAQGYHLPNLAGVVLVGVHRADGVDEARHGVQPGGPGRPHRHFQVAHVVQRIVGRVVADSAGRDPLRGELHNVVGKQLEGEQALAPVMHDEGRLPHPSAQDAHAFPGVLAQVAHADVEDRAADQVDRLEAGPVEARRDVRHRCGGHAGGPQALVCVAQGDVDERNRAFLGHGFSFSAVLHRCFTRSSDIRSRGDNVFGGSGSLRSPA